MKMAKIISGIEAMAAEMKRRNQRNERRWRNEA
jgi:hypothetical protein